MICKFNINTKSILFALTLESSEKKKKNQIGKRNDEKNKRIPNKFACEQHMKSMPAARNSSFSS